MLASASRRLLAYAIDAVLLTAILYVAFIGFGALIGPSIEIRPDGSDLHVVVDVGRSITAALLSAAISSIYFVGSWVLFPATPGQRLLGLRVSRAGDSRPLSLGRATLRWALLLGPLYVGALAGTPMPELRAPILVLTAVWYLVLFVTTLSSPSRQGLHDRWAGSAVLAHRSRPAT